MKARVTIEYDPEWPEGLSLAQPEGMGEA